MLLELLAFGTASVLDDMHAREGASVPRPPRRPRRWMWKWRTGAQPVRAGAALAGAGGGFRQPAEMGR